MRNTTRAPAARSLLYTAACFILASCGGGGGGDNSGASPNPPVGNRAPVASDITVTADPATPLITQNLSASDPDGNPIQFFLDSPPSGAGYKDAYVDPQGVLYATLTVTGGLVAIAYRATDGSLASSPKTVSIAVQPSAATSTGSRDIDPADYANTTAASYDGSRQGNPNAAATLPASVDLSAAFPPPGDQGQESSCVGWAVAYGLKSYQERVENEWPLSTATVFSPAYVYNQINGGQDDGSLIDDALDLVIAQGAASLATMPYVAGDFLSQPSSTARAEALNYRASKKYRVRSIDQAKAALVQRKPIVAGLSVYPQLQQLFGSGSVYNTAVPPRLGGHAVVIVGYDDNRFGGSFKVMNSWGRDTGDGGFFYLPYSFASTVIDVAYTLDDATTGNAVVPYTPEPDPSLPNLGVLNWASQVAGVPGATGSLTYQVANSGSGSAQAGADVALVLSTQNTLASTVQVLVYETIPFAIAPGGGAFRDSTNKLNYTLPAVADGIYYLGMVVNGLGAVNESRYDDNFSPSSGSFAVQNTQPNLAVDFWYAQFINQQGDAVLEYQIRNAGATAVNSAGWPIALYLTTDEDFSAYYVLFAEQGIPVQAGGTVFRNQNNPAFFNANVDVDGTPIPAGEYLAAFVADPTYTIPDSNRYDNFSFAPGTVSYGQGKSSRPDGNVIGFNGSRLESGNVKWEKVRIYTDETGARAMAKIDAAPSVGASDEIGGAITLRASDPIIFPTQMLRRMPD